MKALQPQFPVVKRSSRALVASALAGLAVASLAATGCSLLPFGGPSSEAPPAPIVGRPSTSSVEATDAIVVKDVPSVVGKDAVAAMKTLRAAGFECRVKWERDREEPFRQVISQSPEGASVPTDTIVEITVSRGETEIPGVPVSKLSTATTGPFLFVSKGSKQSVYIRLPGGHAGILPAFASTDWKIYLTRKGGRRQLLGSSDRARYPGLELAWFHPSIRRGDYRLEVETAKDTDWAVQIFAGSVADQMDVAMRKTLH